MATATATAVRPFREVVGGKLVLNFHVGQTKAWESERRFVFLLGGTQLGKTCFGPHWLYREIQRCGPGDYIAATATYPLLKLKMLPEFLEVFENILHLGTWREGDKVFVFHDGATRVIFASATNPESVESATAKAAWLDEVGQTQFRREAWDAILRRLSLGQGRVLGTTTLYGSGWLKNEIFDRWMQGDKNIDVIQVDSIVNPAFPREEYERARASLPSWKFDLFYRGRFAKPAGMIYDSFDESICRIKRFALPVEWPRYVGHDFGTQNTAALWFAQDPGTGYIYAYREYWKGGCSTEDHIAKFKELSRGETILKRVGGSKSEDTWRDEYRKWGWPVAPPKISEVEVGIDRVYGIMKANRLFIFDDLVQSLDQVMSYSRELDERYQPTAKIEDKERFHLLDCARAILSDFQPAIARFNVKPIKLGKVY